MKHNVPSRLFLAFALAGLSAGARPADAVVVTPRGPAAIISPIVVDTFADEFANNGLCSLREAVESVRQHTSVGGCDFPLIGTPSIELAIGTYTLTRTGTITGGSLNLNGTVIINGVGMTQTVIRQAVGGERVIAVDTGRATLRDLAITGGNGSEGGGVQNNAIATLDSVRVFSNSASGGGGLANSTFSTMTIQSSLVDKNTASQGGGIRNSGNLTMKASAVVSNTASSAGGGIASDGSTTLVNTTVISNSAGSGLGGGIRHNSAGPLQLRNTTVARNASGNVGAGLHLSIGDASVMVLENTIVAENIQTGVGRSDCSGNFGQALYSLVAAGGCGFAPVFKNRIGTPGVPVTPHFGAMGFV
ncbi:MAG: CSLREA domain-containing protein, partial [Thermoflexales bacterium]|nr:CSLREA domain-containing protein [Thermoflexales bacterium]